MEITLVSEQNFDEAIGGINSDYDAVIEKPEIFNLVDKAVDVLEGVQYGKTAQTIATAPTKRCFVVEVTPGETYYFSELCTSIGQVFLCSDYDVDGSFPRHATLINDIYSYGVKGWNRNVTLPSNCHYIIFNETIGDEKPNKYIGDEENYGKPSDTYKIKSDVRVLDSELLGEIDGIKEQMKVVRIGAGLDFETVKEGFEYAVANDLPCMIAPGVYDLVAEGISGKGYILPKKVYGYGAVLKCDLPTENWALSPLNVNIEAESTEVYGLTVECSNCRYCIHDEMGFSNLMQYHNIYKDLTLIHKSEGTSVLIAPQCIGGGLGNGGYVEIVNCIFDSKEPKNRDVSYHSMARKEAGSAEYTPQEIASRVVCKDSYFAGRIGFANSGNYTTVMNIGYVSNCTFGVPLVNAAEINIKMVEWNNHVRN